jgi:hypothetical protein
MIETFYNRGNTDRSAKKGVEFRAWTSQTGTPGGTAPRDIPRLAMRDPRREQNLFKEASFGTVMLCNDN